MKKIAVSLATTLLLSSPALAQSEGETRATVYLWGTEVTQELANGAEAVASFSDILDNLDFAFMGEIVHRTGPWLFGFDGVYADISTGDGAAFPISPGRPDDPASIQNLANFDTTTYVAYGFAGYELIDSEDLLLFGTGGLRYTRFDTDITVDTDTQSFRFGASDELWDAVVGVRGSVRLTDRWSLPFIADIGTGDSDLTYQLFGGVSYQVGASNFTLGYRQMVWDIGPGANLVESYDYSGPVLAYSFTF